MVHDVGVNDSDDYYYLDEYQDIRREDTKEIEKQLSEKLAKAFHIKEAKGILYGPYSRIIVSIPVRVGLESKNCFFLLDTGTPKTFICEEVFESFKEDLLDGSSTHYRVFINNQPTIAHLPPVNSTFTDINLLGTEYLKQVNAKVIVDFKNNSASISFHNEDYHSLDIFKTSSFLLFSVIILILFYRVFFRF